MTHGRIAKAGPNSRSKNKSRDRVSGAWFSEKHGKLLENRVAALEVQMAQMQEEIDRLSGVAVPAQIQEAIDNIGNPQIDRRKKINDGELLLNRDNLAQWLEEHWPQIVKPLLAAKNAREVAAMLRPIAKPAEIRPEWQKRIVGHPAKLYQFLHSEKFRRKPPKKTAADALATYQSEKRQRAANRLPTRQIANAMAGVPYLKWRTSLDKCAENPCSLRVGHNAAMHYRAFFGIYEQG
jgi:hypothetical protein